MCNPAPGGNERSDSPVYEIRVQGRLDSRWAERFDGMSITQAGEGDSLLTGPVADQAALYGLLRAVRDLGLPLLSVRRLPLEQPDARTADNDNPIPAHPSIPSIPGGQQ